jgi:predicted flap endonuclease-1-like 5' DNA nuclease
MQAVETVKTRSQEGFANLVAKVQTQPDAVKTWSVTAGSALVGALTLATTANGVLAILASLAAPPVALAVGAVGGGLLGWSYIHNQQAPQPAATPADAAPVADPATKGAMVVEALVDPTSIDPTPVEPAEIAQTGDDATVILSQTEADVEPSVLMAIAPPLTPVAGDDGVTEQPVETAPALPTETAAMLAPTDADDLTTINGIGPVYASRLQADGIQTFAQLAELSPERLQEIVGALRSGNMIDGASWVAQARQLAAASEG